MTDDGGLMTDDGGRRTEGGRVGGWEGVGGWGGRWDFFFSWLGVVGILLLG